MTGHASAATPAASGASHAVCLLVKDMSLPPVSIATPHLGRAVLLPGVEPGFSRPMAEAFPDEEPKYPYLLRVTFSNKVDRLNRLMDTDRQAAAGRMSGRARRTREPGRREN